MGYPNLKDLKYNSLKYEHKEIEILHPYACYNDNRQMHQKIKVYFEGETFNGQPHGYCFVRYIFEKDKVQDSRSFKGVGLMLNGEFHRGPALFQTGDGQRLSFAFMAHGRPQGFGKFYRADGFKSCIESKKLLADTSGWAHQIGNFQDGRQQGQGLAFMADGRVFQGLFHSMRLHAGEMSMLDEKGRRKVYSQEYNY